MVKDWKKAVTERLSRKPFIKEYRSYDNLFEKNLQLMSLADRVGTQFKINKSEVLRYISSVKNKYL